MGTGTVNENLARGGLPSASKMTQIVHCPASFRLNKDELPKPSSDAANEGTMLHRYMELFAITNGNNATDAHWAELHELESKLTAEQHTTVECAQDKMIHLLNNFRSKIGNDLAVDAQEYPELRLKLNDLNNNTIMSGKGDYLYIVGYRAFVVDYKFGRGYVEPADRNYQLASLAVLVKQNFLNVSSVEVHIIQPRAQEYDRRITSAIYEMADIVYANEVIQKTCKEAIESEKPRQEIGYWCQFCESKYRCRAAQTAMNKQMELVAQGIEITTDNVRDTFEKAKFVREFCSEIIKKCNDVVKGNPDIETGLYFAKNPPTRSISDSLKALEWLENKLGRELTNEELCNLISFKIGDLEKFFINEIKSQNPDKKITKKTLSEAFASELNALGLIEYNAKADTLKVKG